MSPILTRLTIQFAGVRHRPSELGRPHQRSYILRRGEPRRARPRQLRRQQRSPVRPVLHFMDRLRRDEVMAVANLPPAAHRAIRGNQPERYLTAPDRQAVLGLVEGLFRLEPGREDSYVPQ